MCLLCVQCVSAYPVHVSASMNYSSTYKGTGHVGHVHTTSSAHVHSIGTTGGLAQAPAASMSSTSSYAGRGISYSGGASVSMPQVSGIRTSASSIRGGVTTYDGGRRYVPGRRNAGKDTPPSAGTPGYCDGCNYIWIVDEERPDGGYWACSECGCELEDGCECGDCHCNVPLECGWEVMLFLACMGGYHVYSSKRRKKKETATPLV